MQALVAKPSALPPRPCRCPALPSPSSSAVRQPPRHGIHHLPSLAGSIGPTGGDGAVPPSSSGSSSSSNPGAPPGQDGAKPGLFQRVKEWFTGSKDREKLASLGVAAFFSYSFISNVTYGICLTIAWIAFVKQKGTTPLADGQWAPFLAFYAGLWTLQNIIRPLRFALSIAMAPLFDRFLDFLAARFGGDKKIAFTIGLMIMSWLMITCLFGAIYLLGGLPDGLGPFPPLRRF